MRILHWTESFYPRIGGTEIFVQHLAKQQQENGHSCLVLTGALPGTAEYESIHGFKIQRIPFHRHLLERSLPGIQRIQHRVDNLISEFAPDVIHLHTSQASAFFLTRTRRPPTLYTAHDGLLPEIHPPSSLLGQILALVDRVAAPSEAIKNDLCRMFPDVIDKIQRIYGSLPLPSIATHPPRILGDSPHLLALGRLVQEKAFDILIRALPIVRQSIPTINVTIAGDGPEAEALQALATALSLVSAVRFAGWTPPDDVPDLIESATVVVVPSRWKEPFGLVALQAMQMGRPVIASRVGGLEEIVDHGRTGSLVVADDEDELARAIIALIKNPEHLSTWGANGRERAVNLFAWDACVEAYEGNYREMSR